MPPPPPPHGAVVHAVRPVRTRNCASFPLFRRRSNNLFRRRSSGHWNVARTSPEQVVGTSPEQGVWVGSASLRHPCLQDGMTETEALGAALAAPPPPAPLGAQGPRAPSHAAALRWLRQPLPHLRALPNILRGQPPLTGHRSRHGLPHKGPRSRASPSASPPVARALDWELNE